MVVQKSKALSESACQLEFAEAIEADDLGRALLLIENATPDTCQVSLERIDALSREVADNLSTRADGSPGEALSDVLCGQVGNKGSFFGAAIEQGYLSVILDGVPGLPSLVCAVWKLVGAKAGIDVDVVRMPGRFLVKIDGHELRDPICGGRIIQVHEAMALANRFMADDEVWDPRCLDPISTSALCSVVLRFHSIEQLDNDDLSGLNRSLQRLQVVRPTCLELVYHRARLAQSLGMLWEVAAHCQILAESNSPLANWAKLWLGRCGDTQHFAH